MLTGTQPDNETARREPPPPAECLWMAAGVVGYKLCDAAFDCENCPFDQGMRGLRGVAARGHAVDPERVAVAAVFYDPGHVWARVEGGGTVRVGIDDFGQRLLGRVYAVELPRPGDRVVCGRDAWRVTHRCGESALAAPVSGRVIDVNAQLALAPSLLNRSPYDRGWAFLVDPDDLDGCLKRLRYGQAAEAWMRSEARRLAGADPAPASVESFFAGAPRDPGAAAHARREPKAR